MGHAAGELADGLHLLRLAELLLQPPPFRDVALDADEVRQPAGLVVDGETDKAFQKAVPSLR